MSTMTDQHVMLRHDLRPGDLGRVIEQHGVLYAAEFGFDHTFEAYAAETLGDFGRTARPKNNQKSVSRADNADVIRPTGYRFIILSKYGERS